MTALRQVSPQAAVCICYVAAMFMNGMDATIVNVALPAIAGEFSVPASATSAVNVGYLVSLAVCIPVSGWLGDRFGTKRVFLGAFGVFVLASALCGLAGDLTQLTLARVLQGAGGGVMSPVALTMLFRAYPPEQRIRLSRVLLLPTAVAPALGPVLGGFFVENLTWRWGFYVNVPVGALALLFGALRLVEHVEAREKRFD
ncbi:MFS transporter, partial [Saccharopolyspora sp. NPDC002686]